MDKYIDDLLINYKKENESMNMLYKGQLVANKLLLEENKRLKKEIECLKRGYEKQFKTLGLNTEVVVNEVIVNEV